MKVSIVLATYNRKALLKETINEYLSQTYQNKEIIVIDNASSDGTREMLLGDFPKEEFPELKCIFLDTNISIKAINIAIAISTGDIIWRTDDDAYLQNKDDLEKVVQYFKNFDNVGILAAGLINRDRENNIDYFVNWHHAHDINDKIPNEGFDSHIFHGAGAGIRRSVLNKIGYFWEFGHEEIEITTRAIMNNFDVKYYPEIKIIHLGANFSGIYHESRLEVETLQLIRYHFRYYPIFIAFLRMMAVLTFQFMQAVKSGIKIHIQISIVFKAIYKAIETYKYERTPFLKKYLKKISNKNTLYSEYKVRFVTYFKKRLKIGYP